MLKNRIIACLNLKKGVVVQSISFKRYFPVGKPNIAVEFLNSWGIDEIVLLDMEATEEKRKPNFKLVAEVSAKGFVPLTVGGGISSLEDIRELIKCGADKVSLNTAAVENPFLIKEAAGVFGNQCVVVSIDAKKNQERKYEVFTHSGKKGTGIGPVELAQKAEELGAGEILLNSIERDGTQSGYDLELIRMVSSAVSIPVIACGGAGHPAHFLEVFQSKSTNAAAAGNYFHFTEHSPIITKAFLKNHQVEVRLDTYAQYDGFGFDEKGRLKKKDEACLRELQFEFHPKEII